MKREPGGADTDTRLATLDMSKAVGSIHDTSIPCRPNSMVASCGPGQPMMLGGVVSTGKGITIMYYMTIEDHNYSTFVFSFNTYLMRITLGRSHSKRK